VRPSGGRTARARRSAAASAAASGRAEPPSAPSPLSPAAPRRVSERRGAGRREESVARGGARCGSRSMPGPARVMTTAPTRGPRPRPRPRSRRTPRPEPGSRSRRPSRRGGRGTSSS
jgi:hypothetical protein